MVLVIRWCGLVGSDPTGGARAGPDRFCGPASWSSADWTEQNQGFSVIGTRTSAGQNHWVLVQLVTQMEVSGSCSFRPKL